MANVLVTGGTGFIGSRSLRCSPRTTRYSACVIKKSHTRTNQIEIRKSIPWLET